MKHILIVDDDQQVLQLLKVIIQKEGLGCDQAETAAEALTAIERRRPDLVFLDIVLPDMTGLDLLAILKQKYPELLVIVMTGLNQADNIWKKAMKAGASDYITKPFGHGDVVVNLRHYLKLDAGE